MYKNGSPLGTVSVTAWAPYSGGGYIGLWYSNASGAIVDDFGGGNVSAAATATPTNTATPMQTNTPSLTPTITNTPTITSTPPLTLTPSDTPIPSDTPTVTFTPSQTLTPSQTFTPSFTPTLTNTPTLTSTPGQPPQGPVTITYEYDPLYRLTEANYSTGDYYHYTYDAVGNRTSQTTQLAVTSYQYDVANLLTSVNGVNYTWDNNGNLLNDGVNTYAYDSANRLISMSNQSTVNSYQYNGLGDRLTQSVNGSTTTYALDINSSLPEVLSDGQFTYLYGLDNIAQVNAGGTQYFLGDALNSTRQLTNASAQITLAHSYDPFGSVSFSAGNGQSVYGYTSEQSDPSGLMYLRARYYNPDTGRFTSRDTWEGNDNIPMSFNLWNYVQSNPVNYTDPSGHDKCLSGEFDYRARADFAEKYVQRKNVDILNTYTAAGIGVQCYSLDRPYRDKYQGAGIAQITDRQVEEAYGDKVFHLGKDGKPDEFDENGKPIVRGYGLRCWIFLANNCTVCKTRDELQATLRNGQEFEAVYKLEDIHGQVKETDWAVEYMRRRIQQVLDNCIGCNDTDRFIAAALGQNGPGLHPGAMRDLSIAGPNNDFRSAPYLPIDWEAYFADRIQRNPRQGTHDTRLQLELFFGVARELHRRSPTGWYIPSRLNNRYIRDLNDG